MATNYGAIFSGLGALAGAWGSYAGAKKQSKIAQEKLDYQKERDKLADTKMDTAQLNLEDAFSNSDLNSLNKKKKKKDINSYDLTV
ncbi:MAG: hypothetical protein Q9M32_02275 [Sulfurimonas sp.]|nr:hypothetical protein [Sulfurimonas sp.]